MDSLFPNQINFPEPRRVLPLWISAAGQEVLPPHFKISRNALGTEHNPYLLLVTRRGAGWFMDNQGDFHPQVQGDYLILGGKDDFLLYSTGDNVWEVLYILLECKEEPDLLQGIRNDGGFSYSFGINHPLYEELARIYRSHEVGFGGDQYQVSLSAYKVLMEWYRAMDRKDRHEWPWLQSARRMVEKDDTATIHQWAKKHGAESDFFYKAVEENFGFPPQVFLNYLKIEKLLRIFHKRDNNRRKLLSNSDLSHHELDTFLQEVIGMDLLAYSESYVPTS